MKTVVVRNIKRTDGGLVKRLGVLGVATAHEAYGRHGLMKPYMRPVWQGGEAAGTAVTVLTHPEIGEAPRRARRCHRARGLWPTRIDEALYAAGLAGRRGGRHGGHRADPS